jgi:uncharacterized protein (TIGR03083 family)
MTTVVDLQEMVFNALDELCSPLSDEEWAKQTDCPGWSVQDNISHIIGTESSAVLGRPRPEHDPGEKEWVRNPIGASNEVEVDYRRSRSPQEVLEEFREVTGERMKQLRSMSEADLDGDSWTPIGPGKVRDLVAIRVMDCWVHEQDIRRALGKPGDLTGPVAEHAFGRHAGAMGFVVGKKAGAPEGTTAVFDVAGFGVIPIVVEGRARVLDSAPDDPTVKLSMDLETFNCLCCGRGDPEVVGRSVKVEGDAELGARIIGSMNFMI